MKNEKEWYIELYQKPGTTTHECLRQIVAESRRRTISECREIVQEMVISKSDPMTPFDVGHNFGMEKVIASLDAMK